PLVLPSFPTRRSSVLRSIPSSRSRYAYRCAGASIARRAVDVPLAAHAHVRVQREAAAHLDQEVFANRANALDRSSADRLIVIDADRKSTRLNSRHLVI